MHSIPWDSRQLRDGAADVGPADAKVSGTAVLATDAGDLAAFRAWLRSERGVEPPEDWDLFTIDIDALTVVSVDDGQLVVDRWSTTDGRQTTRRSLSPAAAPKTLGRGLPHSGTTPRHGNGPTSSIAGRNALRPWPADEAGCTWCR